MRGLENFGGMARRPVRANSHGGPTPVGGIEQMASGVHAHSAERGIVAAPWSLVVALLPTLAALFAVEAYGPTLRAIIDLRPDLLTPAIVALAAICTAFGFLRYPAEAKSARLLLLGLSLASGLYALLLGADIAVADAPAHEALAASIGPAMRYAVPLAALFALLSVWRPSFAVLPFVVVTLHKDLTRSLSGATHMGSSDYLPLVEVGFFLAVGFSALALMRRSVRRSEGRTVALDPAWAGSLLLAVAIGAHLGNYFMSGMAKVMLDGGPFSWALENPTASLMLAGYNLGTAPLAAFPAIFDALHAGLSALEIPLNVATLGAQLLCFLAFLHRRALIGFALFFDAMHIAIFALTGAMFVTWIVLNSLIVAAVARTSPRFFRPSVIVTGMLVTVLGHQVFWNAELGWYDGRQVRHAYFTAIDAEGTEHRVPHSFFRESSYLLLGRQFGYKEHTRPSSHVPTSSWGQIGIQTVPAAEYGLSNREVMERARDCAVPAPSASSAADYDEQAVAAFIRGQHRRAMAYKEAGRRNRYHAYPHHHLAVPSLFQGFDALDPTAVVAYRYVVETVCLDAAPEGLVRRVMHRTASQRIAIDD